jgi:hypothetical protein
VLFGINRHIHSGQKILHFIAIYTLQTHLCCLGLTVTYTQVKKILYFIAIYTLQTHKKCMHIYSVFLTTHIRSVQSDIKHKIMQDCMRVNLKPEINSRILKPALTWRMPSSWMQRCTALVRNGVLQLLVIAYVGHSSMVLSTLMMEAIRCSEMSVLTRATWRHISEEGVNSHSRENFKRYNVQIFS